MYSHKIYKCALTSILVCKSLLGLCLLTYSAAPFTGSKIRIWIIALTYLISELAKDNELHHYFPRTMVAFTYFGNMRKPLIIFVIILLILYLVFRKSFFNVRTYSGYVPPEGSLDIKYPFFMASFIFWGSTVNLFHRFSHMRECENHFIITYLQKTGILCSHKHHSMHHQTVDSKYCVLSEYANYLLDSIHFWRVLKYIVFVFTNIKPDRKLAYDDYAEIHNYMHENAKLECPDRPTLQDIEILHLFSFQTPIFI